MCLYVGSLLCSISYLFLCMMSAFILIIQEIVGLNVIAIVAFNDPLEALFFSEC